MPRPIRPRAPIVAAAQFVSQLTCLVLLGVDPRRFLDLVVPVCRPDVVRVGRLRLVPLEVAVQAIRSMTTEDEGAEPDDHDDDGQPETVAGVLGAIGMELG
jgi:hypothetical protein